MWQIITTDIFDEWYNSLDDSDRTNVLTGMLLLREKGPSLKRPYADTVRDSKFNKMKELRIQSNGEPLRAFFAFDPARKGILLCAGNKSSDKHFYKRMISIADEVFEKHLEGMKPHG